MERSGIQVIAETPDYGAARLHPGYKRRNFRLMKYVIYIWDTTLVRFSEKNWALYMSSFASTCLNDDLLAKTTLNICNRALLSKVEFQ